MSFKSAGCLPVFRAILTVPSTVWRVRSLAHLPRKPHKDPRVNESLQEEEHETRAAAAQSRHCVHPFFIHFDGRSYGLKECHGVAHSIVVNKRAASQGCCAFLDQGRGVGHDANHGSPLRQGGLNG